jgi:hypothetical protein
VAAPSPVLALWQSSLPDLPSTGYKARSLLIGDLLRRWRLCDSLYAFIHPSRWSALSISLCDSGCEYHRSLDKAELDPFPLYFFNILVYCLFFSSPLAYGAAFAGKD